MFFISSTFDNNFIQTKVKSLKTRDLTNKELLSNEVGVEASVIAKTKSIRKISIF